MRAELGRRQPRRQVLGSVRHEVCAERHFGLGEPPSAELYLVMNALPPVRALSATYFPMRSSQP